MRRDVRGWCAIRAWDQALGWWLPSTSEHEELRAWGTQGGGWAARECAHSLAARTWYCRARLNVGPRVGDAAGQPHIRTWGAARMGDTSRWSGWCERAGLVAARTWCFRARQNFGPVWATRPGQRTSEHAELRAWARELGAGHGWVGGVDVASVWAGARLGGRSRSGGMGLARHWLVARAGLKMALRGGGGYPSHHAVRV
ncbi:hypothetical protein FIBSPDRAFT_901197 [Athelia psychrophila]|uniref:Uncharacterized protein n=1 Tax=Athelia psychrophila TaxID=1759441 RepID=A0A165XHT0_9AGAM|nr:hypothetical protein FIBSPDRAFT_901197 [Fibularhizoctonia sp. CBS 109695]